MDKISSRDISFPKSEQSLLKKRLDQGKDIYTTQIKDEKGKYKVGDVLKSPIGKLKVVSVKEDVTVKNFPFKDELSKKQLKAVFKEPWDLVRLTKLGFTIKNSLS